MNWPESAFLAVVVVTIGFILSQVTACEQHKQSTRLECLKSGKISSECNFQ